MYVNSEDGRDSERRKTHCNHDKPVVRELRLPTSYFEGLDEVWTIDAPAGKLITVQVRAFCSVSLGPFFK